MFLLCAVSTVRPGYAVHLIQTRWRAFIRKRNETIQLFQGRERRSLIVSQLTNLLMHICKHKTHILYFYHFRLANGGCQMLDLSYWKENFRISSWKTSQFFTHPLRYVTTGIIQYPFASPVRYITGQSLHYNCTTNVWCEQAQVLR